MSRNPAALSVYSSRDSDVDSLSVGPPVSRFPSSSSVTFPRDCFSPSASFSSSSSVSSNPHVSLHDVFPSILHDWKSRREILTALLSIKDAIPPSPTNPYTPRELAVYWLTERFTRNPFIFSVPEESLYLYKKVANKTKPVATTLPERFRIIRHEHPNPLEGLVPLPTHPPVFTPKGRFTQERRDKMSAGKDFLWPEEIKLAEWIVGEHNKAFAWTDDERGSFDPKYFAPIEIPHVEHVPWALRQGPIPRGILDEVIKIIEEKWRSGVYEPSSSSYNSRWFCVFKKDGKSLRLVHSLEPLNAVTVRNSAMPPYTDLVAEDFAGRAVYTTLDLYVSFDQRQLHENSRDLTTFSSPFGAFRLTVLPMGWTNSPAVLQGDVNHMLRPEIPHNTIPYADDVPIKGPATRYQKENGAYETIPENSGIRRFVWEHFLVVHRIIHRTRSYGATYSGKKAFIGVERADVLGYTCAFEGRIADPGRVKVIQNWPVPTSVSEVRSFLGTCGVLRIFIKGYTLIARPLIQLTRKDVPFEIGPEHLDAIEKLKTAVVNSPALRPIEYDCDRPVILAVDSCANRVGYILLQIGKDGKRYPSRFGSITFNDRECRYSQAKLELYGLLRALKHTQLYTIGAKKLIVEMDAKFIKGMINNPTLHPNDAINRWISAILLFDFELVHIPADKHTGADGLSRRPRAPQDDDLEPVEELENWIDTNAGFFIELNTPASCYDSVPPLSAFRSLSAVYTAAASSSSANDSSPSSSSDSSSDIEIPRTDKALLRDAKLSIIRRFLTTLQRPPKLSDNEYRQFIRQATNYFVVDGKMFRKNRDSPPQLVPEPGGRLRLITYAHDHLGHKGVFATTRNLLIRFWWPHVNEDVRWFIGTCHECQVRQTEYFHIPPVVPDVPSLFRKAHVDVFLMPAVGKYRYVIHGRCAMSSWPEGRGTTSQTGKVVGEFLCEHFLCRWSWLVEIATDNGAPIVAGVEYLAETYGIRHIKISGYNSQANGIIESKHHDVRESIMKTCRGDESKWRQVLPIVLWAERTTIRRSTGYSPYFMAHGVHPILPFDIIESTYLSPPQDSGMTTEDLIALRACQLEKRPEQLEEMRAVVTKSRVRNLEQFEKKHLSRIVDFDFKPGALVLVRNTRVEDSLNRKTKPRYLGPMVVVRKTPGTSYIVAELDGSQSNVRVAGFRLIPYFPRTTGSYPVAEEFDGNNDKSWDDPEDVRYLSSLPEHERSYSFIPSPTL